MVREIKFRVWNMNTKLFYYHSVRDFEEIQKINELCTDDMGNNLIEQQFTGLKDKNGKEIYFGDIIKYSGNQIPQYQDENTLYLVEWVLDRIVGTPVDYLHEPEYVGGGHLIDWLLSADREVVGNIYENPELVKKND